MIEDHTLSSVQDVLKQKQKVSVPIKHYVASVKSDCLKSAHWFWCWSVQTINWVKKTGQKLCSIFQLKCNLAPSEVGLHDQSKLNCKGNKSQLGRSCDCPAYHSVKHGSVIRSKFPSEGQRALSHRNSKYAPQKKSRKCISLQLNKQI